MLIAALIVLNLPVYLFLGWLIFDTKDDAADTFFETIVALLKIIFIPPIIRVLMGMEDDGALGIFPILGFFLGCGAIVYGEYYLIQTYVLGGP